MFSEHHGATSALTDGAVGGIAGGVLGSFFLIAIGFITYRRRMRRRATPQIGRDGITTIEPYLFHTSIFRNGGIRKNEDRNHGTARGTSTSAISALPSIDAGTRLSGEGAEIIKHIDGGPLFLEVPSIHGPVNRRSVG